MDVAYAFLNHHHSIWINGEQFCIWHSYFTDNMQNIFTYTHIDCLIYRKGEKNDAKNAPFKWTRTEPKAENLVQLIESKVSFVVPFNSDCVLRLYRARFSQESLGMFSELRGIGHWCAVISRCKPFWKSAPYDIIWGRKWACVHLDVCWINQSTSLPSGLKQMLLIYPSHI